MLQRLSALYDERRHLIRPGTILHDLIVPDWVSGVLLASGVQAIGLSIALVAGASAGRAGGRLATVLMIMAGMTLPYIFGWRGHAEPPGWLAFLPLVVPLALGPALLGYTHGATGSGARLGRVHWIAPGAQIAYLVISACLPPQLQLTWRSGVHDKLVKPSLEVAVLVSLWGYGTTCLLETLRFNFNLKQVRSDADRFTLRWLVVVLGGLLATVVALTGIRAYTTWIGELDTRYFFLWIAAFSCMLGLGGWRRAALPVIAFPIPPTIQPRRSREPDWQALGAKWRERTRAEGWWREPDLSLPELSRRLGVNASYASRAINQGLGSNYNEMINGIRVEAVAEEIKSGSQSDFLALALEAGFSSKATFNRAFKHAFNMTPTAYRKRITS